MPLLESDTGLQHQLVTRWLDASTRTDDLFDTIAPEALYDRPIPERHRIIFYLGHLEAFDWNLLAPVLGLKSVNPDFDKLFAFGIDPVGGGLPADQASDWPLLAEARRYNRTVRLALEAGVERVDTAADSPLSDGVLLNVAIEHRLMHAETLTYMMHQLPFARKLAPPLLSAPEAPATVHGIVEIPAGTAMLGLPRLRPGWRASTNHGAGGNGSNGFGWDNEFEAQEVRVPAFSIDTYKVTNGRYLEFVRAGGYSEPRLWSSEDWEWIRRSGIKHPIFWIERNGAWFYRTMFAEVRLPKEWPVYVSHAEASAFARWADKKLPTEAQFHRAAYAGRKGSEPKYPWGNQAPERARGNFDFYNWDPTAVEAHPAGRSAFGVADLVGNGWEWTSSLFAPFPGFEPFPFYEGYSANFFDGKHYVMKGGSPRTAACMLRKSFRNWFQPHYQYIYAGFRCVSE